ncbi:hypothetical protein [Streptomyces sp. NPDC002215]|uniref:hypothetical protein n=1 Tax=Streptomyces sp. NPDC002215 TaxID=3154412 RepID=UPI00332CE168
MQTELPGAIRQAFTHLEHRVTHLEDALAQAVELLRATGQLDANEHAEFAASLPARREWFEQIMRDLSREESEWTQIQDYDDHGDCAPTQNLS